MKSLPVIAMMFAIAVHGLASARANDTKSMDMNGTKDMGKQQANKGAKVTHHATGTVTAVDPEKGTVTLAHGPIKSLNWPAMTMGFIVKDKVLFDRLSPGKKADVEIVQEDGKYVISSVK